MKIGVYYTHYQCLGHTARVYTLLRAIKKRYPFVDSCLIQGAKSQEFLRFPPDVRVSLLPRPIFTRESFKTPLTVNRKNLELRAACLLHLIKKYGLDVFMTEYFPLGRNICKYELLPALYFLKKNRKRIISAAGYPVISGISIKDFNTLLKFYDKVYIHSPYIEYEYISGSYKDKRQKNEYADIFKKNFDKIVFTGYVVSDRLKFTEEKEVTEYQNNKINILVTRGAGAYYPAIIKASIKASELLGNDYYFVIVAGPSTSDAEWQVFNKLMNGKKLQNAVLKKYSPYLKKLIRESDLCISTASYNTAVDILYYKKKSIIIPFEGYGDMYYREQPCRAELLKDFISSAIIRYPELTALKLKEKISEQINKSRTANLKIPQDWFQGKKNFLKEIALYLR